jgi:type IV secretory pathway TraG/TraD family ATPase VirD4
MNQRPPRPTWGPTQPTDQRPRRWWSVTLFVGLLMAPDKPVFIGFIGAAVIPMLWRAHRALAKKRTPAGARNISPNSLSAVLDHVADEGGGAFLGVSERGRWRLSRPQRAVLLLGPPRSGKSAGLIIPAVLSHSGPVVSTSTKPDVLRPTLNARSRLGRVWEFDPTGVRTLTESSL